MSGVLALSDRDLMELTPRLVSVEQNATATVIEHLVEIDRRRLYLGQACSSLYKYCLERLGYSEYEALKRVRVARLAMRLPKVLAELRDGRSQALKERLARSRWLLPKKRALKLRLARSR